MFCVKATVDFTFSKCAEVVVPHDKPSDIFCLPGGEVILSRLRTVIFLPDAIWFLLSLRLCLQQSPENASLIALTKLFIGLDKGILSIHKVFYWLQYHFLWFFILFKKYAYRFFVQILFKLPIAKNLLIPDKHTFQSRFCWGVSTLTHYYSELSIL